MLLRTVVIISLLTFTVAGYKHVVFMHGILAGPEEWTLYKNLIEQFHPGTPITIVDKYNDLMTLVPMWTQVHSIADSLKPVMTNLSSEGTILVCFSQGGLICRGLLSVLKHNVDTFISLSSPLAGQFGDTDFLKHLFPHYLKDNLFKIFYSSKGQDVSVGNYWFDPHHLGLYEKFSSYLGLINNQTVLPNPQIEEWRSNFLRLKTAILVGGPDDGVITPWQSSQFGMYDANETVMPMERQRWYMSDAFGLRTLNERGSVHLHTISGIQHFKWHKNKRVFEVCIKPLLT